jgi:hypothetical protein
VGLALCISGTLEGRVHYVRTRPLRFQHTLSECLALLHVEVQGGIYSRFNNTALPRCDVPRGDVCSGNLQDFPFRGAI